MLPRDFTEEQHMFRDAYRKFLAAEIVPHMEAWREAGIVDRAAFRRAGEQGFLMVWPDEQYGGMGDADFRFERFAVDGNLPPVLRNLDGGGPILRCNQMKSVAIVQNAQPLCKDKACKTKMTWRDFATVDLAPKSSGPHTPVIRPDEFKMGEEAAKNTALDNMRILSETYSGMATFRLLERCGLIEPQNTNTNTNTKPVP